MSLSPVSPRSDLVFTIRDEINDLQQVVKTIQADMIDLKKFIQIKSKLEKMEFLFSNHTIPLLESVNMEKPLFRKSIEQIAKTLSFETSIRVRVVGYTNEEAKQDRCALCAEFIKMCILGVKQNSPVASNRLEVVSEYPLRQQPNGISRVVLEVESDKKPFSIIDPVNIDPNTKIVFKFQPRKFTIDNSDENLKKVKNILYYLITNPDKKLDITGYGNAEGLFKKNHAGKRAQSVQDYILFFSQNPKDDLSRLIKKDNVLAHYTTQARNRCATVSVPSIVPVRQDDRKIISLDTLPIPASDEED